jgi:hypothetical protein
MEELQRMLITWTPPVTDNSWMSMVRMGTVPHVERKIVVGISDVMDLEEFNVDEWELPCLN